MKFLYATSITYPSRLANRLQTVSMAREFAKQLRGQFLLGGISISQVDKDVPIKNFPGSTKSFVLAGKYLQYAYKNRVTHIFCREERLLFFLILYNIFFRTPLFFMYEAHFLPKRPGVIFRTLFCFSGCIVVLTTHAKKQLVEWGVTPEKVLVCPDGVEVEKFDINLTKEQARTHLGLPHDKKIALYTGHLFSWKGVDTLARASSLCGENALVVFVGGTEKDVRQFRKKHGSHSNIRIVGYRPHEEIPVWLRATDVVVLPNTAQEDISNLYTSPLKLFEYLASGGVIVASRIPSLMDILGEDNAILVSPDSEESLAEGIKRALSEDKLSQRISQNARRTALRFTWEKRAASILQSLGSKE